MTSKGSSKEGRGESGRSSHSHGKQHHHHYHHNRSSLPPGAPAEPLFPRVHVSETRNGPKAPPRNKMALYEQLTVPSSQHFIHRQASASVWPPYASQYAPYVAGSCFTPCYVPPGVAFHAADGGHAAPGGVSAGAFYGSSPLGSQKSMVVDSEADKDLLQRVPRVVEDPPPPSPPPSTACPSTVRTPSAASGLPLPAAGGIPRESNKRVRHEDDFAVPTYSSPKSSGKKHDEARTCQQGVGGLVQKVSSSRGKAHRAPPVNNAEQICSSNVWESAAGSENNSDNDNDNDNDNDFFQSLHEDQDSGDSGASIVDCAGKIAARDVIGAVGEREFWKTRKNLIRQQRIFAKQVFELHRVVKVQHFLAESPKVLLEPSTDSVPLLEPAKPSHVAPPVEECRAIQPAARTPRTSKTVTPSTDVNLKQRNQPERAVVQVQQQQEQEPPANNQHASTSAPPVPPTTTATSYPMQPNAFAPGASNSWGYAAYGPGSNMNHQWTMVPQPYMFQSPYSTTYQPPPPYQPVFGAPGGYEMYSMVQRPRAAEMPVYWAPAMAAMPPNAQSSPWFAFPQQYYGSTTQAAPKVPRSANSTVMSPSLVQEQQSVQQQQQQQHQQQVRRLAESAQNSEHSSMVYGTGVQLHEQRQVQQSLQGEQQQSTQSEEQHFQSKRGREVRWTEPEQTMFAPYNLPSAYERHQEQAQPTVHHQHQQQQHHQHQQQHHQQQQQHHQQQHHQQQQQLPDSRAGLKVVPRAVMATPESGAGILKSLQRERR